MKLFCSRKLDYFKTEFFTKYDKMLNFVNFKNGGTCVRWRILDVMFRMSPNILMAKLTDTSAYLGK